MLEDPLLHELILTFALALAVIVALARLHVPHILALIATGAIVGPWGTRIVRTQTDAQTLAEIGIVLLLFTLGLDFSLGDFRRLWTRVIGGSLLQIGVTAVAVLSFLAAATDRSLLASLFIVLFVALSSTAIILKELSSRNQLHTPHGRLTVGVLIEHAARRSLDVERQVLPPRRATPRDRCENQKRWVLLMQSIGRRLVAHPLQERLSTGIIATNLICVPLMSA